MTENVFPLEKVGDYFSRHFINIKMDMEKGEGPEIGRMFNVTAFPTFIIFNPDGTMRHMFSGRDEPDRFIEKVQESFDDDNAVGVMDMKLENGELDTAGMLQYVRLLRDNDNHKASDMALAIFGSLDNDQRVAPEYWILYAGKSLAPEGSERQKYLIANVDRFRASVGKEIVDSRISGLYMQKLSAIIIQGEAQKYSIDDLNKMTAEIKGYKLSSEPELLVYGNVARLVLDKNRDISSYRREVEAVSAPLILFLYVSHQIGDDLTPAQIKEWKAWGQEIADSMDDPAYGEWYRMYMAQVLEM